MPRRWPACTRFNSETLSGRHMAQPDRSSAGTASLPPAVPGIGTGVPPGSHRGRGHLEKLGETDRNDAWWLIPILQATGLVLLIGYANYAAFLGAAHYHYVEAGRDYLSPF